MAYFDFYHFSFFFFIFFIFCIMTIFVRLLRKRLGPRLWRAGWLRGWPAGWRWWLELLAGMPAECLARLWLIARPLPWIYSGLPSLPAGCPQAARLPAGCPTAQLRLWCDSRRPSASIYPVKLRSPLSSH